MKHPSTDKAKTLPEKWRDHFPNSYESAPGWEPIVRWQGLSMTVLAVARTRIECAWAAYIKAVPGVDHDEEMEEVLRTGTKLTENVARAIFPDFEGVPYVG